MERYRHRSVAAIALAAGCACLVSAAPPPVPADIDALITQVSERVGEYYRRAQHLMCIERSTVQPIQSNWAAEGFARTVESDLRFESDAAEAGSLPDARIIREIRRVNGRAPRERDKKDRTGCTDPTPWSPELLSFLLPKHRAEYRFTSIREGRDKDRAALVIDFMSANQTSAPELIEDERGHDDCFDWSGPVATKGRVWVDANSHEVLRVERRNSGPVDVRVPSRLQRRYGFPTWIVLERDELTVRYRAVAFSDPDEVVLLPESIESVTLLRGGLQSIRRSDTFIDYRRFFTTGRVKDR